MKIIHLVLLMLIFLLASPASACPSNHSPECKLETISSNEAKPPVLEYNEFKGTLFISNKNMESFPSPKYSYIKKIENESSKIKKLRISQKFDLERDFIRYCEGYYILTLPYYYISLEDRPTVYYEVIGDEEKVIYSYRAKITDIYFFHGRSNKDNVSFYIPLGSKNNKCISINFYLEHSAKTITHDNIPPVEKKSISITIKIMVFSLILLFLSILKFIHGK